jgi:hypothetical protein
MHDLTYQLLSSDQFGNFCHWFWMPLAKVECLADIFTGHGYIQQPRSLLHQAEFCERAKLLVMSALYLLGRGAAFCLCRSLCHISMSEICKIFFVFLNAFVDMQKEYIKLPDRIGEFNHVT